MTPSEEIDFSKLDGLAAVVIALQGHVEGKTKNKCQQAQGARLYGVGLGF